MSISANTLTIIDEVIWILCILIGAGISSFVGGLFGRLLGWMISVSLDESTIRGGRVGRKVGRVMGLVLGIGLGAFGALQATAFVASMVAR